MMGKNMYFDIGRPNLDLISARRRDGWTEKAIANELGVTERTLANWKNRYPEFAERLKEDRKHVDLVNVVNAYLRRAIGYDVTEYTRQYTVAENGERRLISVYEKTRHIPADVSAAEHWIRTRLAEDDVWKNFAKNVTDVDVVPDGGVVLIPSRVSIEGTHTAPTSHDTPAGACDSIGYNPESVPPSPQDDGVDS